MAHSRRRNFSSPQRDSNPLPLPSLLCDSRLPRRRRVQGDGAALDLLLRCLKVPATTHTTPTPTASASIDAVLDAHSCGHWCTSDDIGSGPASRMGGRRSRSSLQPAAGGYLLRTAAGGALRRRGGCVPWRSLV